MQGSVVHPETCHRIKTAVLDTIGGLDWWTELVDWTTGLIDYHLKMHGDAP